LEIYGYSERGMLNSLFFEIFYNNKVELLQKLLSSIQFRDGKRVFELINAQIYIEQSLSDFGDSDAILLIEDKSSKYTVFIEAKVKTSQRKQWSIKNEIRNFENGIQKNKVNSSNLLTQLIYKSWLIKTLKDNNWKNTLQNGVIPNLPTSKEKRKMGNNQVVKSMIERIKDYSETAFYIALIPDMKNYHLLYEKIDSNLTTIINTLGVISWESIMDFCTDNNLENTIENLKFNKDQIYLKHTI